VLPLTPPLGRASTIEAFCRFVAFLREIHANILKLAAPALHFTGGKR
jgi:hypothetical protein